MKTLLTNIPVYYIVALALVATLCIFGSAHASTTISTDITTGGAISASSTLQVSGAGTFYSTINTPNNGGGYQIDGNTILTASSTNSSMALGHNALNKSYTGTDNIAIGDSTLVGDTNGSENTAAGFQALVDNTSGTGNAVFGFGPMFYNTSGSDNTALGFLPLYQNTTGSYNTVIGYDAGYNMLSGTNNLILASATSSFGVANLTTGSQNILIGNNISLPSATASGQLNIGNIIYGTNVTGTGSTLSSGNVGVGTTTPWQKLSISGGGLYVFNNSDTSLGSTGIATFYGSPGLGTNLPRIYVDGAGANNDIVGLGFKLAGTLKWTLENYNSGTEDFRLTNEQTSATAIAINGSTSNVGIGTTTPATKLQISAGANATTTVTIGELGLTTSKACVNMNQSNGSPGSFYIAGGAIVVSNSYCQ